MMRSLLAAIALAGLTSSLALATATAQADPDPMQALQDIYPQFIRLDSQQPCEIAGLATSACKATIGPKVSLTRHVIPTLWSLPTAPGSPVEVALMNADAVTKSNSRWIAANCDQSPNALMADLTYTCSGGSIQGSFDGLTRDIGLILQGAPTD